jgi:hypothetical protein
MRSDGANSAKAAYQHFLTLWKDADADSDIPILKQPRLSIRSCISFDVGRITSKSEVAVLSNFGSIGAVSGV